MSNIKNRFDQKIFKVVLKNILYLIDNNVRVIINYVISPNNISYFYDSIIFFKENNIKEVSLLTNFETEWKEKDIIDFKKQLYKCFDIFSKLSNYDFKVYPIFNKVNAIIGNKEVLKCNFGNENIVVSQNGKVYPCVSFTEDDEYVITNKNKKFKNIVDIEKCKNCSYERFCVNNCMCRYKKDINNIDLNCEFEKMFIDFSMDIVKQLLKF